MAAITWANVVDFDAALSVVHINVQTAILAYVNTFINVAVFDGEEGADTRLARIYYAAHQGRGTLPGAGAAGGAVTSESGGDGLSVSYAVAASTDELSESAWGRKYLALARTSCAGPVLL